MKNWLFVLRTKELVLIIQVLSGMIFYFIALLLIKDEMLYEAIQKINKSLLKRR